MHALEPLDERGEARQRVADEPGRQLGVEYRQRPGTGQAGEHFVGATYPVDLGETARFPVEINEGLGLGLVEVKTLVDGVGGVVVTLDNVSPTVVAGPGAGLGAGGLEVGATVAADATG